MLAGPGDDCDSSRTTLFRHISFDIARESPGGLACHYIAKLDNVREIKSMAETVRRHHVNHTQYEREKILDEGLRLDRAGKLGSFTSGFALAQKVLAKERRRPTPTSITKITWFVDAVKAAREAAEAPQGADPKARATTIAAADPDAPQGGPDADDGGKRVRWNPQEQQALCMEAARLITDMKAGGRREALMLAQMVVLPKHRRRKIYSMTTVAPWYPDGFQAAIAKLKLQSEPKMAAPVAELAKVNEDIAAQTPEPAPTPEHTLQADPTPATEQDAPPKTMAPPVPANLVMPAVGEDLVSHLAWHWRVIRERIVQEVSNILVEGVHLGIQRITLARPEGEATTAAATSPESARAESPGAPVHKAGSPLNGQAHA